MAKIGFLNNQIDNRGTGNALFDYAHYNEKLLGNESVIFTLDRAPRDLRMEERLLKRFGNVYAYPAGDFGLDVLYHIKSGEDDGYSRAVDKARTKYVAHAVFNGSQPHGDRYAAISSWLGARFNIPWVPHIVDLPDTDENLRSVLNIPSGATVLGRYGGSDTFDIPFVWTAIQRALEVRDDLWFLFLNTDNPNLVTSDRVIFLPQVATPLEKRVFINTCDAMLHARQRGETFGISTGEFAICGKPIFTYSQSPERAHIMELPYAYIYHNEESLLEGLLSSYANQLINENFRGYTKYTPKNVMEKFKAVFLD